MSSGRDRAGRGAAVASAVLLPGARPLSWRWGLLASISSESLIGVGQTGFKSTCGTSSSLPIPEPPSLTCRIGVRIQEEKSGECFEIVEEAGGPALKVVHLRGWRAPHC